MGSVTNKLTWAMTKAQTVVADQSNSRDLFVVHCLADVMPRKFD